MSNKRFELDGSEEKRPETKLLYVTSAKYERDWHSIPHTHYFSEFFYVLRGGGRFLVEGKTFPVRENDLIIVNPNVSHTEMSDNARPLEYVVLGVEGIAFSFQEEEGADTHQVLSFREKRHEIQFYLDTLLREAETRSPYHETVCQNLLEVMIIHMIRETGFSMSVMPSRKANLACGVAKRYIDSHFREPLTLQDLADVTHVSKYYLAHAFTEDYGLSPINYLIARRIEESKNLLKSTDHSISQIASFTGFSSQSYFSQSFRKITGQKPGEYRQKVRRDTADKSLK